HPNAPIWAPRWCPSSRAPVVPAADLVTGVAHLRAATFVRRQAALAARGIRDHKRSARSTSSVLDHQRFHHPDIGPETVRSVAWPVHTLASLKLRVLGTDCDKPSTKEADDVNVEWCRVLVNSCGATKAQVCDEEARCL